MNYRRSYIPGTSYFFTLVLQDRQSSLLLDEITKLKFAFQKTKNDHPFTLDAIVIMPEHLHMIMTLPENDADYSQRIKSIKRYFSQEILVQKEISKSNLIKKEKGIWQRRYWEHVIRNEDDYENHFHYIHYNPTKHGYVTTPSDWKYSSIHKYIANGVLPIDWTNDISLQKYKE